MPDKWFEAKIVKEVSCRTMMLSFPVFGSKMIDAVFAVVFYVFLKKFSDLCKICRNFQ